MTAQEIVDAIQEAVLAERQACAAVARNWHATPYGVPEPEVCGPCATGGHIAESILARSTETVKA